MATKKPWILIDVSYLAHRAKYAVQGLAWEDFPTGVMFGFWEQLKTICNNPYIDSNRVALFFDSRKSYRRKVFPEYKSQRRKNQTNDEQLQSSIMRDQIKLLRTIVLPKVGFPVYLQSGCESDDLIAQAALQLDQKNERGIIITSDGDLWQCITDNIHWYDPARRKFLDVARFRQEKKIHPDHWGSAKCMAGCSGDEVPGIPGVGEKTAVKYLLGELPCHYKTYKSIQSEEGIEISYRNIELVVLPHPKTKPINLLEPDYNTEAFFESCERYGFLTYLKEPKKKDWERFFNQKEVQPRKRGLR